VVQDTRVTFVRRRRRTDARLRRVSSPNMRPLEESEIQQVFEKLFKFVGKNLKNIVDRADQPHCFRLHKKVGYAANFGMGKQSRHREPSYPNNFMAMQIVKPTPFFF
jgi:hypothetical protein